MTPCSSKNQITVLKFWTAELLCIYPPPFKGKQCCILLPAFLRLKKSKEALCVSITVQLKRQFRSAWNWNSCSWLGDSKFLIKKNFKSALVRKKRQSASAAIKISEVCRHRLQGRSPKTLSTCQKLQGLVTGRYFRKPTYNQSEWALSISCLSDVPVSYTRDMVRCLKKSTFTIQLVPSHSLRYYFTTNKAHLLYNKVNNYKCMEANFPFWWHTICEIFGVE